MKATTVEHFHPDERGFVERVYDWVERSAQQHELRRTDFLDPRQAEIVRMIASKEQDVQVVLSGGYDGAERKRALIAPDYAVVDEESLELVLLAVQAVGKDFSELSHGDFLGALLGLGIKRDRVGDIHVHEDECHIVTLATMGEFLDVHLRQVGRQSVLTEIKPLAELRKAEQELREQTFTVASMRLDGVASDAYGISRSKMTELVRAGRCRVNWKPEQSPSALLKEGDVISCQGFGRCKLLAVEGETKKGRIRVRIGKFI